MAFADRAAEFVGHRLPARVDRAAGFVDREDRQVPADRVADRRDRERLVESHRAGSHAHWVLVPAVPSVAVCAGPADDPVAVRPVGVGRLAPHVQVAGR